MSYHKDLRDEIEEYTKDLVEEVLSNTNFKILPSYYEMAEGNERITKLMSVEEYIQISIELFTDLFVESMFKLHYKSVIEKRIDDKLRAYISTYQKVSELKKMLTGFIYYKGNLISYLDLIRLGYPDISKDDCYSFDTYTDYQLIQHNIYQLKVKSSISTIHKSLIEANYRPGSKGYLKAKHHFESLSFK